jgi:hypothetical protein
MPEPSIAVPPPLDPLLTRVSVSFHTNDDDKDNDTLVEKKLQELADSQSGWVSHQFDDGRRSWLPWPLE